MSELKDPQASDPKLDALENIRDLLGMMFIQEQRNYDVLIMIAEKLGADSDALLEMHKQGRVLAPDPSFIYEEQEE